MYRRMIFIGLGGSGGKTLRFTKRDIRRWLKEVGWKRGIPSGWQFLHIDSPTVQDGTSVDVDMLPDAEYLGLVGPGQGFSGIVGTLDSVSDSAIELEGWRVDPAALGVPVGQGAGQFRAVGRTIALAYLPQISSKLRSVISSVNDSGAVAELDDLAGRVSGATPAGATGDPIVVIVSSLAGGTGAGLFMDVCDLMREMAPPWGGDSFAVLYTPEVFSSLGDGATGGVQPNSLGAISELMNGRWLHGGIVNQSAIPPRSSVFHTRAGSGSPVERSGPAFPMLIGSTGGAAGVSFGTDVEVFEMVGRAMMSWATDPVIQTDFLAYEIANWSVAANANQVNGAHDVITNAGSGANPKEAGDPLFSSLGFARVSLGNTYFKEYSEQRLALDAARWATEAVRLSSNAQQHLAVDSSLTASQVAERIASDYLEWFLRETALHERGPEENDVIEALYPADEFRSGMARAEVRAIELTGIDGQATADKWQKALIPAVQQVQRIFFDEIRPSVDQKIRDWIESVQQTVMVAVERSIAIHGIHVTRALLDAVIVELAGDVDSVADELRGEAIDAESYAQNWQAQIVAALEQAPGRLDVNHPAVQAAVADAVKYATQNLYAYLLSNAADLLDQLGNGFLRPLRNALSGALASLESDMDGLSHWPAWNATSVPKALLPPKSEVTVLDPSTFPSEFEEMLAATVGGPPTAVGNHRESARSDVLSGSEIRSQLLQTDSDSATLSRLLGVGLSNSWWPNNVLPQEGQAPSNAAFHVRYSPSDVVNRSSHWLDRSGTAFHDLFDASLASYTAPDDLGGDGGNPEVFRERQRRFLESFSKARSLSTPLIRLDPDLLGMLHPQTDVEIRVSSVPFAGHPLEEDMENQLQTLFGKASNADSLIKHAMSADRDVTSIDIMSTLQAPVSPLVIESLLEPISSAWGAAKPSHVSRDAFWAHRKARSLMEFIPLPQEHILASVRGFFTARMLGLLELDGGKVLIKTPSGIVAQFPDPLLRPFTNSKDLLPALLESLPLAMIEVQRVGSVEPLVPYTALRDYGWQTSEQRASQILDYEVPATVLANWIDTGHVDGLGQVLAPLRNIPSAEDRRAAAEEFLLRTESDYQEQYAAYLQNVQSKKMKISQTPDWPSLWPAIRTALRQLAEAVESAPAANFDDETM
ncbi:MAG: tubulin-like doman-containing protein [Actinomycetia bacterium]|nr:tubulin-like doman-containing protein [Actinomycetes bacterium]